MPGWKQWSQAAWVGALALLVWSSPATSETVTERAGSVDRDSAVSGETDSFGADAVDSEAGMLSKTFHAPDPRTFRDFTEQEKQNQAPESKIDLILSEGWSKDSVSESETAIGVDLLTNDITSANQFPILADGNLNSGSGGSGGETPHWAAVVKTIDLSILSAPRVISADATTGDIPIAFQIHSNNAFDVSDISAISAWITVDGEEHELAVSNADIVNGDEAERSAAGSNVFTLFVHEDEFDDIEVEYDRTPVASLRIKVTITSGGTSHVRESSEHELDAFTDKDVQVAQYMIDGSEDLATYQGICFGDAEFGIQTIDAQTNMFGPMKEFNGWIPDDSMYDWQTDTGFHKKKITNGNGSAYKIEVSAFQEYDGFRDRRRVTLTHQQRGYYLFIFYGTRDVDGYSRPVLNLSHDGQSGSVKIWAWADGTANAEFEGHVDAGGHANVNWTNVGLGVAGVAVTLVGVILAPGTGGASAAAAISFSISLGGAIMEGTNGLNPSNVEEEAQIYCRNFIWRNIEDGSKANGSLDQENVMTANGWGPAGVHTQSFGVALGDDGLYQFANQYAKAFHTLAGYNSSTVTTEHYRSWLGSVHPKCSVELKPGDDKVHWQW